MNDYRRLAPCFAAALLLPSACNRSAPETRPSAAAQSTGLDLAGIDPSVAPGDDFFAYANGTWVKSTEIPADRGTWGAGERSEEHTSELQSQSNLVCRL